MASVMKSEAFGDQDKSAWCLEKAEQAVRGLAEVVDTLRKTNAMSEELASSIVLALNGATKLLSFTAGAEWGPEDPERIFKNGRAGYEEVKKECGFKD